MPKPKRTARSYLPILGSVCKIKHLSVSSVITGHSFAHGVEQHKTYDETTYEGVVINTEVVRIWEERNNYFLDPRTYGGRVEPYKVFVTYLLVTLGPHTETRRGYKAKNCPDSRLFKVPLGDQTHPDWYKRTGWHIYTTPQK